MELQTSLGAEFAQAVAAKDAERLRALLHPEIDFKALTPRRFWEAGDPDQVAAVIFEHWFEDGDDIEGVEHIDTDAFADRERVGYRFRVRNADGPQIVEQTAYFSTDDGRISWIRVVCSGYRPRS